MDKSKKITQYYTIDMIDVDTIVHGINGYSRVKKCVHGNKYYAYMGDTLYDVYIGAVINDDHGKHINNSVIIIINVLDDDDYHLDCCS